MGKEMSEPQPRQFTHPASANEFIEQQLHEGILKIERLFDADAISINGPILFGLDDSLRFLIEDKNSQDPQRDKLVVVLTTTGGYIEVVQRIVAIFRKHYKLVDFIIPNYAYSAGTVLAMSGDAIHMDYYSRLGPIDPQIETEHGRGVSALGYLERYNDLIKKAGKNEISTAEVQLMIHGFDQGELYAWEQARELSITLLKEWLVQYKFKNWKKTRTRGRRVTSAMKQMRAAAIAKQLNNTKKWHVHGHGISMDVLTRDLRLQIDDFEKNTAMRDAIKEYHSLFTDYMTKTRGNAAAHIAGDYRRTF
jgi:hypothetical protein